MIRLSRRSFACVGWLAAALLLSAAALPVDAQHPKSSARATAAVDRVKETEPVKTYGTRTAPILMEVYSDFQCPSCRGLYEQTLRQLINDYVASGKVFLVHRDFPLPVHPYSFVAARYANAAARIGKFAEVEAALYDNQAAWSVDGSLQKYVSAALSVSEMKHVQSLVDKCGGGSTAAARPARLSTNAQGAEGCVLDSAIEKDVMLGRAVPVQQTPTSIVTYKSQHYPVIGIVSYPILKGFFDQLLRQ